MNNPSQRLVVRRYVKRVYYCIIQQQLGQKELVFYKRELGSDTALPAAVE
ncbi:hypothetical protein [Rufibacter roseus]|uniref:Uncharacterized protein n=1 Tax=Rufibacter roseus TaxID=1567108 RepID=A0ABW2DLX3_9BACT|nr:hypothetical protein [Rufibacter roseus]